MFERRKEKLLHEKLAALMRKHDLLLKAGKMAEANQVLSDMNNIYSELEKIGNKRSDKAFRDFERTTKKNDKLLDKIGGQQAPFIPDVTDEEIEDLINGRQK